MSLALAMTLGCVGELRTEEADAGDGFGTGRTGLVGDAGGPSPTDGGGAANDGSAADRGSASDGSGTAIADQDGGARDTGAGVTEPPPPCGDGVCQAEEHCGTCPADCGACAAAPVTVVRGPYLQLGSDTAMSVRWRTDVPTDSVVVWGGAPGPLDRATTDDALTTEHEVRLEGLAPRTGYVYAVGATGHELVGGDAAYTFRTAPRPGVAAPVRVWAVGDSGTANSNARAVRDAFLSFTGTRGADLWLMLGDNAYSDGTDSQYQDAVFETYPSILRTTALYSTLGNHDGHSASSASQTGPYYDIFTLPTDAEVGGVASGTEAYYSFEHANIHFVCLDSYDSDTSAGSPMMSWLELDLMATTQPWIVAFWHHPPYTKGSHDSDSEGRLVDMRERAVPVLEGFGVDLVLSGHSHSYERSMLIHGHYGDSDSLDSSMILDPGDGREGGDGAYRKPVPETRGAVYIVAGSSGLSSGGSLDHEAMRVSLAELGSVVFDVDGLRLDASFLDDAGAVRDEFTIRKEAP